MEYSGLVELVDLFPTLVDLAGLPALEQCPSDSHKVEVCTEGVSLSQIINRNQEEIERQAKNKRNDESIEGFDASRVEGNGILSHLTNLGDMKNRFIQSEESKQTKNEINDDNNEGFDARNINSNAILNQHTNLDHTKNRLILSAESDRNVILKRAAFSQYPRPGPVPSKNPDSDQPHTRDTAIMGYSIRTDRFRFTAWLRFDNITYRPDWDHIVAEELYDHKIDPSEDCNLIGKGSYARKRKDLFGVLRGGWRSAVRWR